MLERVTAPSGVVFYLSPLLKGLNVPHAFSTRVGGLSPAPFDSLNLGNPNGCAVQDDRPRIWENYGRLEAAAGLSGRERCYVHQAHGPRVVWVEPTRPHDCAQKADALHTTDPARVLSVRTADCVPILLATSDGRHVAVVHAGWRGVLAGVLLEALRALTAGGDQVCAAIGPSIGMDAFEAGAEVIDGFERAFGTQPFIRRRDDGKGHVDLKAALKAQLRSAGLPDEHIDVSDRCTVRDRDEFFSHRRENGVTGRMAALIGVRY